MALALPAVPWSAAARLLGLALGTRTRGAGTATAPAFAAAVREGLPFTAIQSLARGSGVPVEAVVQALRIPARTLARRRASGQLTADESDRLSRLARTVALALAVLGERERASAWLATPNRALGGAAPLTLVDTDIGVTQVEEVLQRIQHGIAS